MTLVDEIRKCADECDYSENDQAVRHEIVENEEPEHQNIRCNFYDVPFQKSIQLEKQYSCGQDKAQNRENPGFQGRGGVVQNP